METSKHPLETAGVNRRINNGYLRVAISIAVIMFAGFARNYYLRAWIGTRVISVMVHLHGLVMTAWVIVFVTQTLLVSRQRIDLHRRLGLFGAGLAAVVVGLGIFTIAGSIQRQQPDAGSRLLVELFVAFDGVSLLVFAGLVIAALIFRRRRDIHKRLMLAAMISLMPPAYGRLTAYFTQHDVELIVLGLMYASVLSCLLADSCHRRRMHPALAIGSLLIIASNQLTYFAQTYTQ